MAVKNPGAWTAWGEALQGMGGLVDKGADIVREKNMVSTLVQKGMDEGWLSPADAEEVIKASEGKYSRYKSRLDKIEGRREADARSEFDRRQSLRKSQADMAPAPTSSTSALGILPSYVTELPRPELPQEQFSFEREQPMDKMAFAEQQGITPQSLARKRYLGMGSSDLMKLADMAKPTPKQPNLSSEAYRKLSAINQAQALLLRDDGGFVDSQTGPAKFNAYEEEKARIMSGVGINVGQQRVQQEASQISTAKTQKELSKKTELGDFVKLMKSIESKNKGMLADKYFTELPDNWAMVPDIINEVSIRLKQFLAENGGYKNLDEYNKATKKATQ